MTRAAAPNANASVWHRTCDMCGSFVIGSKKAPEVKQLTPLELVSAVKETAPAPYGLGTFKFVWPWLSRFFPQQRVESSASRTPQVWWPPAASEAQPPLTAGTMVSPLTLYPQQRTA